MPLFYVLYHPLPQVGVMGNDAAIKAKAIFNYLFEGKHLYVKMILDICVRYLK